MFHARRFKGNESGSSAVEFALVLPAVLLLIFGAIAAGVMMYTAVKLQHATETSARCLSAQRSDCSLSNITPFAKTYYTGPTLGGLTFTASSQSCGYNVTASGTFSFFTGLGMLSIPVRTSACYPSPTASS